MNKKTFIITLCVCLLFISYKAYGLYFTIHLKNGNSIRAENYWSDDDTGVRFFTESGYVTLPKGIIDYVAKSDGFLSTSVSLTPQSIEEPGLEELEDEEPLADRGTRQPASQVPGDEDKTALIADLSDRIIVIDTNIENLQRNKLTYLARRDRHLQDKEKAESRLANLPNTPYITSEDLKERTTLEEQKMNEVEEKISQIDTQIAGTDRMLENQMRMGDRLKEELQKYE